MLKSKVILLSAMLGSVVFGFTAKANAFTWEIESSHSHAQFSVRHMMISNVRGDFSRVSGTVDYDGKNIDQAKVDATIDVSAVNTGEAARDKHLLQADFFDFAKYPKMIFKSKKVVPVDAGHFKLIGDLTLRGITKEVTLDVDGPTPEIKDPQGNVKIGASETTKINRKDFGISMNNVLDNGGAMIGNDVAITIDLELVKKTK
jgi:polyisoprenoid-binding protein YceI